MLHSSFSVSILLSYGYTFIKQIYVTQYLHDVDSFACNQHDKM